ncbi:MAG TPA: hypothetical protein VEL05_07860 [Candidatus Acidoferrum sp.]|nr:hypothetical protein [Candidatus Acidoferrum sp.]
MNRTLTAAPILAIAGMFALASLAGCGGDDDAVDASIEPDAPPPAGTISMSWRVQSGGTDASCQDVGAQLVEVELVLEGAVNGEADSFTCAAAAATTREVAVGTYILRLDLLDSMSASLLPAQVIQSGVEVTDGNDTPLGEILFAVVE